MVIDNGNHLLLSGNAEARAFLRTIGTEDQLVGPQTAEFPFVDLASGARWTLRPNAGRLPWWIFAPGRRVPGTRARDYLALGKLLRAGAQATIGETMACEGDLYRKLWQPLLLAALNTDPPESSAKLAGAIIRETLALRRRGLPADDRREGTRRRLRRSLRSPGSPPPAPRSGSTIRCAASPSPTGARARSTSATRTVELGPDDRVVLAVPAPARDGLPAGPRGAEELPVHRQRAFQDGAAVATCRRSSGWSGARSSGSSPSRTASRSPSAAPTACWTCRARSWRGRCGPTSGKPRGLRPSCRRGRSSGRNERPFAATPVEDARRPGPWTRLASNLVLGGRLDRDRTARDHRRVDPVGQPSCGAAVASSGREIEAFAQRRPSMPPLRTRVSSHCSEVAVQVLLAEPCPERSALRTTHSRCSTCFNPTCATRPPPVFGIDGIDHAIAKAETALLSTQRPDGHFVFELEADVSIPSEYILFKHFRGAEIRYGIGQKFARYLRTHQTAGGGWPLFADGGFNISSSVKAYFALKLLGDPVDAPHMARARTAILKHGGAAQANVFTRALLALFGEVPWEAVPVMPVEIMHLPTWFPFHMEKVSYWARTVLAPMMVVNAIRPRARNPLDVHIAELFVTPAFEVKHWPGGAGKVTGADGRLQRDRQGAADGRAASSRWPTRACDRQGRSLDHRATQRDRRSRRDLPGDCLFRADVRGARLRGGRSAPHPGPRGDRGARRRVRRLRLPAALRVAGVGHLARRARADGIGPRPKRRGGQGGDGLARAAPGARRAR